MSNTILVPLDGSELAEKALPFAAAIARAGHKQLLLLHAAPAYALTETPPSDDEVLVQIDAIVDRLRAQGVEVGSHVSRVYYWEEAARAIRETARERDAELIVMSTHGRGGMGRWLWGSISDTVMRETQVPVLLVPAACDHEWAADRPLRILVPLDGSPLAEQVLAPTTAVADALGAELHLLRAVLPIEYVYAGMYGGVAPYYVYDLDAELNDAKQYLEGIAERLRSDGRSVTVHTATGTPVQAIADVVQKLGIDMAAMATHGRGGVARLLLGSVATGVVERATVPLLLMRPTAAPAAKEQPAEPGPTVQQAEGQPPEPVAATIALTLSPAELTLLQRGLGELLYMPARDPRLVEPVQALMTRLKQAQPSGNR